MSEGRKLMKTSYPSLPRSRFLRALLRISAPSLVLVLAPLFPVSEAAQIPADGNPPAPEKQEPAPAVPPQAGEGFKWGPMEGHSEVEVGFRWVSDIAGNRDMYRSMVNLGQGPKLLRSTLSLRADSGRPQPADRPGNPQCYGAPGPPAAARGRVAQSSRPRPPGLGPLSTSVFARNPTDGRTL